MPLVLLNLTLSKEVKNMAVGVLGAKYEPPEEYIFHAKNDVGRISKGDIVIINRHSKAKENDIVLCVDMILRHYKGNEKIIIGTVKKQCIEY